MPASVPSGTQSIVRTVNLLKALGTRRQIGWRLTDLAAQCGLTTSTTHRIMGCLVAMRLARQRGEDKRYVPGPGLYEFGLTVPLYFQFQAGCAASVRRVSVRTGCVTFLALRSGDETVCIDRQGTTSVNIMNDIGRRLPMAGSSLGVAMLLRLQRVEQQRVLGENRRTLRSNPAHRRRSYEVMWRRSEQAGLGLNLGDIVPGGASMSVPVADDAGIPLAAIGVAGPLAEFSESRIAMMREVLSDEASRIEREQARLIAQLSAE